MGLFSLIGKLFQGGDSAEAEQESTADAVEYKGFQIIPQPRKIGGQYGVGALICKEVDGESRQYQLLRSDQMSSRDDCIELSISKAKRTIDEQGERVFS